MKQYIRNYKHQAHCKICKKLTSGLEEGVCDSCRKENLLQRNNPKGFNKYKKNPNPTPPKKSELQQLIDEFSVKPFNDKYDYLRKEGNDIVMESRALFKRKKRHTILSNIFWRREDG